MICPLHKLKRAGALFALVTLVVVSRADAQAPSGDVRTDLGSALRVVRPLMRDDPDRAISMLQRLRAEYPRQTRLHFLLGETFLVIGATDSARVAFERCLEIDPRNGQAGSALGMLYLKEGDRNKATEVFQALLERTEHGIGSYRAIGAALSRGGFYDVAIEMYREGRRRSGGNYILTLDIAYLLELMGRHGDALREYLTVIETEPRQHRLAQTKIMELLRQHEEERQALTQLLREDAERDAPYRGYVFAVLAVAYLEEGLLENSLEMALRADKPGTSDGRVLFDLAERVVLKYQSDPTADRQRLFDLGLRALKAYADRFPGTPLQPRARLLLVDLLMDLGAGRAGAHVMTRDLAVSKAHVSLDWILASFPGSEYAEHAYLKKGDLLFHVEHKPREALAVYERGMARARLKRQDFVERLGRAYLVLEEYAAASKEFARMAESPSADVREAGIFFTGMMLCFSGEYEAARDTLTSLAESNPASNHANDAIELAWMIEEGLQGEQSVINQFTDGLKAEAAGDTLVVVARMKAVADLPADTPLRSRALIRLGDVYRAMGAYDEAVAAYERFSSDYEGDTRVPDVRRKIAQVYEYGYGRINMALETYESILVDHPYYLFLDEVRRDVNRIRQSLRAQ